MERRLLLHERLEAIPGVVKAYFQEPPNTAMKYPCIKYELDDVEVIYADNIPYQRTKRWQITVIDQDPESPISEAVAGLPTSAFDRSFRADNLNHFVYNLFF